MQVFLAGDDVIFRVYSGRFPFRTVEIFHLEVHALTDF